MRGNGVIEYDGNSYYVTFTRVRHWRNEESGQWAA
jgi:hypothetical protein